MGTAHRDIQTFKCVECPSQFLDELDAQNHYADKHKNLCAVKAMLEQMHKVADETPNKPNFL